MRWTLSDSLRHTEDSTGATVILSSHVDLVGLHNAQFWYRFNSRRCLGKQPARHAMRVVRSLARALAEPLRQERTETHMRGMLPTYVNTCCADDNTVQSWWQTPGGF